MKVGWVDVRLVRIMTNRWLLQFIGQGDSGMHSLHYAARPISGIILGVAA